jgi:DNA topoisomerase-2
VGSNNLNLLEPVGQFGTRQQGGKDVASARYIYTNLNHLTRLVYPEADMPVLEYQKEEGQSIEPVYYVPIIPMVLVNGSEGIGTGWSSSIPQFNPLEVIDCIEAKIMGKSIRNLQPWMRGWQGELSQVDENQYQTAGRFSIQSNDHVEITELPMKKWTADFKQMLE